MNYRLSVAVKRPMGKVGYTLDVKGRTVESYVGKMSTDNIKNEILSTIAKGLRMCRSYLTHDDILYIDVQNRHLQQWLDGFVEYKGYVDGLDEVFDVLESLDCRYKFVFNSNPYAGVYISKNEKTTLSGSSISSIDFD